MKNSLYFILICSVFFFLKPAHAIVELKTGIFAHTSSDLTYTRGSFPLTLERQYNHKSNSEGIFGKKWCSEFELHLEVAEEKVRVLECGESHSPDFKRSGKNFFAGKEKIVSLKNGAHVWLKNNRETWLFSPEGQLLEVSPLSDEKIGAVRLFYDKKGRLKTIGYLGRDAFRLTYNADGFVQEINGPKNIKLTYAYDKGYLTENQNIWKNTYKYKYDAAGRMIEIIYPDQKKNLISYNDKSNTVAGVQTKNNCKINYNYNLDHATAKLNLNVTNSCKKNTAQMSISNSPLFAINQKKRTTSATASSATRTVASTTSATAAGSNSTKAFDANNPQNANAKVDTKVTKDNLSRPTRITTADYIYTIAYHKGSSDIKQISELNLNSKDERKVEFYYQAGRLTRLKDPFMGTLSFLYGPSGEVIKTISSPSDYAKVRILETYQRFENAQKEIQ